MDSQGPRLSRAYDASTRQAATRECALLDSTGLRDSSLDPGWRAAGHLAGAVGEIPAFRQVEHDQDVVERAGRDCGPAHGDTEWPGEPPATGGRPHPGRPVRRCDQPIRRVLWAGSEDDLCVAARHPLSSLPG